MFFLHKSQLYIHFLPIFQIRFVWEEVIIGEIFTESIATWSEYSKFKNTFCVPEAFGLVYQHLTYISWYYWSKIYMLLVFLLFLDNNSSDIS